VMCVCKWARGRLTQRGRRDANGILTLIPPASASSLPRQRLKARQPSWFEFSFAAKKWQNYKNEKIRVGGKGGREGSGSVRESE
jgi:hypothetical protein